MTFIAPLNPASKSNFEPSKAAHQIPLTPHALEVRECCLQTHDMNKLNYILLKTVRWSGWPLLPLVLLFLLTGYIMDGRYGLSRLLDEKSALTFHRMLHIPLIVLVLAHSLPAAYLAIQRWGWIKPRGES